MGSANQAGRHRLTPWGTTFDNSALLRLTVNDNGEEAVGGIVDWATFMRLRAQRPTIPAEPDNFDTIADRSMTDVDLADFLNKDARLLDDPANPIRGPQVASS